MSKYKICIALIFCILLGAVIIVNNNIEKNKIHPARRFRDKINKDDQVKKFENDSMGYTTTNDSVVSIDKEGDKSIQLQWNGAVFEIRFLSYDVLSARDFENKAEYNAVYFFNNEVPVENETRTYFDREGASHESEIMYKLFGPDAGNMEPSEWGRLYYDNVEEVEAFKEKHYYNYTVFVDYYFVKIRITNLSLEERDDKESIVGDGEFYVNSLFIVMSDNGGSYYLSEEAVYLYNAIHTDPGDKEKSFFKLEIEPGESREVIVGFPVVYDTYMYPDLKDKSSYKAYIGLLDMDLVDDGEDPAMGIDMISLSDIKKGLE